MSCIFCKIVNKEVPKKPEEIIFEDSELLAFPDINPKAPVHILIMSKTHIPSVKELEESQEALVGKMVLAARGIAREKKLEGYKLVFNVGREGGQIINHLHLHLLGGWGQSPKEIEI